MSYYRVKDNLIIEWKPEDQEIGQEAVKDVTETTDYPIEVDKEIAEEIRERYKEIQEKEEDE